jgi:hypothetical protein
MIDDHTWHLSSTSSAVEYNRAPSYLNMYIRHTPDIFQPHGEVSLSYTIQLIPYDHSFFSIVSMWADNQTIRLVKNVESMNWYAWETACVVWWYRLCAFIMHCAQDQFVAHVFHCDPSAGALCKTIEAACKVRSSTPNTCQPHCANASGSCI